MRDLLNLAHHRSSYTAISHVTCLTADSTDRRSAAPFIRTLIRVCGACYLTITRLSIEPGEYHVSTAGPDSLHVMSHTGSRHGLRDLDLERFRLWKRGNRRTGEYNGCGILTKVSKMEMKLI